MRITRNPSGSANVVLCAAQYGARHLQEPTVGAVGRDLSGRALIGQPGCLQIELMLDSPQGLRRDLAAVWGSAQVTLPALDIAPPAVFSPKAEVAIDTLHHTVTQ
jgi:hypothetical protein